MRRAVLAAAVALNGTPKSRGRDFTHTDGTGLKSPNASSAVTTKPARAADAAAARVETPARRTRMDREMSVFDLKSLLTSTVPSGTVLLAALGRRHGGRYVAVWLGGSPGWKCSVRRQRRPDVGGRRAGDVHERRPPNPSEELPNLSSTRTNWTDVAPDLSGGAPVGTFHQSQSREPADAAMVRRSTTRSVRQRSVSAA